MPLIRANKCGAMRGRTANLPDLVGTLSNYRYIQSFSAIGTLSNCGAMRGRTANLLRARQALSQLSYSPKRLKI